MELGLTVCVPILFKWWGMFTAKMKCANSFLLFNLIVQEKHSKLISTHKHTQRERSARYWKSEILTILFGTLQSVVCVCEYVRVFMCSKSQMIQLCLNS